MHNLIAKLHRSYCVIVIKQMLAPSSTEHGVERKMGLNPFTLYAHSTFWLRTQFYRYLKLCLDVFQLSVCLCVICWCRFLSHVFSIHAAAAAAARFEFVQPLEPQSRSTS